MILLVRKDLFLLVGLALLEALTLYSHTDMAEDEANPGKCRVNRWGKNIF